MRAGIPSDMGQLLDRIRQAEQSPKNVRTRSLWKGWQRTAGGEFDERPGQSPSFPITIEPEAPLWADILNFSLVRFYNDPEEYLRRNMQMSLYRFEHWDEDTCIARRIRIWMGVSFEASLFGAETHYGEGQCPWLGGRVVRSREDFERLQVPDFQSSGLMPQAHRFYERIREILPDDFDVDFPDWERSPFGVCTHLRGTEDMLVDLVQDPDFARAQLRFMTDCRKEWARMRAEFLGQDVQPGVLLNDEVNGALFPPRLYEEFILPGEIKLGQFQGINYWHSCGKTTDFLPLIRQIPGLEIFHVSPWTDVARGADEMQGLALQVCMDPVKDVQRASDDHIRQRIKRIAAACRATPFTIRADGLHTIDTVEKELEAIAHWLALAKQMRSNVPESGTTGSADSG